MTGSVREPLSHGDENSQQKHPGKQEVGQGSGRHDPAPLTQPLGVERDRTFLLAQVRALPRRLADRVGVAEHLDVSAERDEAEFPSGLGAIGPAEYLLAESDGENLDPHAIAPSDQEMAHLVHEDQNRQDNQERYQDGQNLIDRFHTLGIQAATRSQGQATI